MTDEVLCLVADLYFASKIRAVGESVGRNVRFVKSPDSLLKEAAHRRPHTLILDLNVAPPDLKAFLDQLRSELQWEGVPIIGFYSHVDDFLRKSALEAGVGQVLPRSAFTRRLGELLSLKNTELSEHVNNDEN